MRFMIARGERAPKTGPAARLRRAKRWSRRQILAGAASVLVVLSAAAWWLERSGIIAETALAAENRFLGWTARLGLAVADVRVEGRERVSREAILSALGIARGAPILGLDPGEAKRRLETVPWVRTASVERRLPDVLYIRLVERQPLAFWQRQGKLVLIDREGVVVPAERLEVFGDLIVLVGADAPKTGPALLEMLASEPELAAHVSAAVRVGGRRWNLRLDNGIDVALPEEETAAAWHRLAALERKDGILERQVEMIDLRLPDRLMLRMPPAEPVKNPPKKGRQLGSAT
jgi:cell division protein FtsQ